MKKSKIIAITAILAVLLSVGIILTAVGASAISKDKKFVNSAESTVAYITSHMNTNGVREYYLTYTVDGKNYETDFKFNRENGDFIGKDVRVYFTKDAPEKVFIKTANSNYAMLYTGIALTVVCIILFGMIFIPVCVRKYIIKNGETELVRIIKFVDVIGGTKILCDSTKVRGKNAPPFKSATLKTKFSKDMLNSAVKVYYLPKHKMFYCIDTIKFKEGK